MAAMISRSLSSRLLKPALSSTSSPYSHSARWVANAMTTPEFQPSKAGPLLHGSTPFCTDSSSELFYEKTRYFQSSYSKNQGNHLAKLKILDARFVIPSSAHNVKFGIPLSSAGNVRFFTTKPENPNQSPDSEEPLLLVKEKREVLGGVRKHMNQFRKAMMALGIGVSFTFPPTLTLAVFWHVNKGIEEIMADYVHQEMTRNWILVYLRFFFLIAIKDVFLSLVF